MNHGRKKEDANERIFMYGFACFFFGAIIQRIFFFISDFYVEGTYVGHSFYGDPFSNVNPTYVILVLFGHMSLHMGLTLFYFTFERVIKRTKYILTSLSLIFIIIMVIDINFVYVFNFISLMMMISVLIWLSLRSSEEFQIVSVILLIGFSLFWLGLILNSRVLRHLLKISPALAPLITIISSLFIISPIYINPEFLSKSRPFIHWSILGVFCGIWLWILLYFLFISILPFWFVIAALISIFPLTFMILYSINRVIRILRTEEKSVKTEEKTEEKEDFQDFLRIFTKPRKLSEEEVSISKEKKICLVCKGKLERKMYICPDCSTFYCSNCSDTLVELENACWVCNTPFDKSKPSKPFYKEEEEIQITESEELQKKKNKKDLF